VYVDTKTVEPVTYNPWNATVAVSGTDGSQFSSNMMADYVPTVFFNSFFRPMNFSY